MMLDGKRCTRATAIDTTPFVVALGCFRKGARIDGMRSHLCLPMSLCGQCLGHPATDTEEYSI